ncbi:MAG: hypothetical protein PGN08_06265 [Sphingomonas taxi]
MTAPGAFLDALAAMPKGYLEGDADGRRYGATVTRSPDGRRQWLYAEELGGEDRISFNLYLLESGPALRPCEMPAKKVIAFVLAFRPNPTSAGRPKTSSARSSLSTTDDRISA